MDLRDIEPDTDADGEPVKEVQLQDLGRSDDVMALMIIPKIAFNFGRSDNQRF